MEQDVHVRIEAYLGGSMSLEDQKAFEEELSNNQELREEVSLNASINHHFNQESWETIKTSVQTKGQKELIDYFKTEDATDLKKKLNFARQKYSKSKQSSFSKCIAAAAIVLLVVSASYFLLFNEKSYDDLYVEYYNEKDLPSLVTRASVNDLLSEGVIAYKNKDYKGALNLFDEYINNTDFKNSLVYSYKGMSHLQLKDNDQAISSFNQLLNSDSIDRSKALWYKCMVYLKEKDGKKLRSTLQQIIENPSNFNYAKAKELLTEL